MSDEQDLQEINPTIQVQRDAETSTIRPQTETQNEDLPSNTLSTHTDPNVTVKFVLLPMNQIITFAYPINILVKDLKAKISADLKMEPKNLKFYIHHDDRKFIFFLKDLKFNPQ